jgi:hypothetical protein
MVSGTNQYRGSCRYLVAEPVLDVYTTDKTKTKQPSGTVLERYRVGRLTEGEAKHLESVVVR